MINFMEVIPFENYIANLDFQISHGLKDGTPNGKRIANIARLCKAELTKVSKDKGVDVVEVDHIPVLKSIAKKLKEEIESLKSANNPDLADRINNLQLDLCFVELELPKALSDDEINISIIAIDQEGTPKNIGAFMKRLKEKHGEAIDGKKASELLRQYFALQPQ